MIEKGITCPSCGNRMCERVATTNDSQVQRLTVNKMPGKNDSVEIKVEEL